MGFQGDLGERCTVPRSFWSSGAKNLFLRTLKNSNEKLIPQDRKSCLKSPISQD